MKLNKYICNLLLALIIIYFAQGSIYEQGSIYSQSALFLIFAISGFYFIKTFLITKKNLFYKVFTALMLLNILGYIFTGDITNPFHFNQIKTILLVALPFYPFYFFAQKGSLKEKHLIWFFIASIPLTIASFYYNQNQILSMMRSNNVNLVNNIAYTFVFLIPFVFLIKNKKILSSLIVILLLFFIIQGAKRGALLTGAIGTLFFAYYQIKTIDKKNRTKGYLITGVVIIALAYYAYNFYIANEYLGLRMNSIKEGNSSGRDIIYSNLFKIWVSSENFIHFFFGRGFSKTLIITNSYAHNDWLELLTNFGLLGVVIYMAMFYAAIRFAFDKQVPNDQRIMMMAIVSMWLMTTAVSMNYATSEAIYQNMLIAYLMGGYKIYKTNKNESKNASNNKTKD